MTKEKHTNGTPPPAYIIQLGIKYRELPNTNPKKLWKKMSDRIPGGYSADVYRNMFDGTQIPLKLRTHHLRAIKFAERRVEKGGNGGRR